MSKRTFFTEPWKAQMLVNRWKNW